MRVTTRLRELLGGPDLLVAPGAYDALSARLIAQAGFSLVYMTGFGTAASVLGQPDVGLLTMSEMVSRGAALAAVTGDLPLIADADTGYGNPINVRRTIYEYERAGVAGLHIEDQVWPKKCGHMESKQVIPMDEMSQKVRAAVDARQDPDLLFSLKRPVLWQNCKPSSRRSPMYRCFTTGLKAAKHHFFHSMRFMPLDSNW